jgi:PKD repeat protein
MFFPKQKILYNKKTNLIELETPTRYDINTDTPADIYTDNINSLQYFKNINFPANYIIGGHIQGVMENPDMVSNISKVFVYITQNLDDVSYESLETIAKYNSGIKNSTIIATRNDNNTSIEITTQQPISNFTIKLINNRNLITADYDGAEIYEDKIRYKNGFYYIYHDVDPGTHTINITDTGVPVHSFSMSSDSGVAPLTVAFNDTSIIKSENLSWDFENDGIVDSTEKNPVHVFEKVGVYSINMTVSSSDGSFSCIKTVTVNPFTSDVLNKLYWFLYKHLSKFLPTSIFT